VGKIKHCSSSLIILKYDHLKFNLIITLSHMIMERNTNGNVGTYVNLNFYLAVAVHVHENM